MKISKQGDYHKRESLILMDGWKFILLLQLCFNIVTLLDVPFARQVIGFFYLLFVPGFVITKMLSLNRSDLTRTFTFSIGLSISILMFLGLFINEFLPILGFLYPLSFLPLMFALNLLILTLYLVSRSSKIKLEINLESYSFSFWLLPFIFLPIVSIIGSYHVNNGGGNSILLFALFLVPVVLLVYTLFGKLKLSPDFHSLALLLIAISILFQTSLMTNYVNGNDIYGEFYVFKSTSNSAIWNPAGLSQNIEINKENSMLSVTILPTIFAKIANIDENVLFKVLYPFILSWVVVALYNLYRTQTSNKTAFFSTFFIISNSVFLMLFASRQMVGELFYVLLFLILLEKNIKHVKKTILFVIFGASLAVSHYAMSYIFMLFIVFVWVFQFLKKRTKTVTFQQILLFFAFIFAWYIFTSKAAPFDSLTNTASMILRRFYTDMFNPQARGTLVITALGQTTTTSILNQIGRLLFYVSEFLIVVGFIYVIRNRKKTSFVEVFVLVLSLNLSILFACIIVPNFALALRMNRFYQIALLFLAPLCVLGGRAILNLLLKQRTSLCYSSILLVIFLTPFFLFQTGVVYAVTGTPNWSLPLNIQDSEVINWSLYTKIVNRQEVLGAEWLQRTTHDLSLKVYADIIARSHVLTGYGMIPFENMQVLSNTTVIDKTAFVYLRRLNIVEGIVQGTNFQWNTSELSPLLSNLNKVYSNGNCEIYNSP